LAIYLNVGRSVLRAGVIFSGFNVFCEVRRILAAMLAAAGAAKVDLFFGDGAVKIDIDNDGVPEQVVTLRLLPGQHTGDSPWGKQQARGSYETT
jgi:hypothetical protein